MDTFNNKTIWLTGASKGIGRALALELAERGAKLALSARNEKELEQLANEMGNQPTLILPMDVTEHAANIAAVTKIMHEWGQLDIAIFNAGNAEYVDVQHFDSALFERSMLTNFQSMVYGIEAALPLLRQSSAPHIVGMSSTAAYGGLPRSEAYGASKAAIRNMLEGLRISLSPENIDVSVICPGFVRTPLTDKNDFPMPMIIEADTAAKIIADGISNRVEEIHFPKMFSLMLKFFSSLPSPMYTRLIRKMVLQK